MLCVLHVTMNAAGGTGSGTSQTPRRADLRFHKHKAGAGPNFLAHSCSSLPLCPGGSESPSSCDLSPSWHKCQTRSHPHPSPAACDKSCRPEASSPLCRMERSVGQKAANRAQPVVQPQRGPPRGSPRRYSPPPTFS